MCVYVCVCVCVGVGLCLMVWGLDSFFKKFSPYWVSTKVFPAVLTLNIFCLDAIFTFFLSWLVFV